jgi:hypothetical protein
MVGYVRSKKMHSDKLVVVTYEDRSSAIPGIELLARSLQRHSPEIELHIYSPLDGLPQRLADVRNATLVQTTDLLGQGWNVKPSVLLRALVGHERVLWLDTDIIVTSDIQFLIRRFDKDATVVGQEFRGLSGNGGPLRAQAYGLAPARSLPYSVNSGSLIVSREHRSLLQAWSRLLSSRRYQAAQSRPIAERPAAFVGDQDALWALLSSRGFADVNVDFFRVGSDMIQHSGANGYHVIDRLLSLCGNVPAFVHMLGRYKPWTFEEVPSIRRNSTDYLHMICFELSPFFEAAQHYSTELGYPEWLRRRTTPAKILNFIFCGNIALRGFPLALASWIAGVGGRRPELKHSRKTT